MNRERLTRYRVLHRVPVPPDRFAVLVDASHQMLVRRAHILVQSVYRFTGNRNLWFVQVDNMLKRARFSQDPKERTWILDELSRSANPIIALYAKLELLLGPPDHSRPA